MSAAGKRFVEVPTQRLEELLEDVGARVAARGGSFRWTVSGRERVFELTPHASKVPTMIRIFTSVSVGLTSVRGCGKDAVRIVVGTTGEGVEGKRFYPLEKGTKLLRTAPRHLPTAHRIEAFITRLKAAIRNAYRRARLVQSCHLCGSPMAVRKGPRKGKGGWEFLGCITYPRCKGTRNVSPGNQ